MNTYIGIDNGISGTIGIYHNKECVFIKTPVIEEQDYTKKQKNVTRLDHVTLYELFYPYCRKSKTVFVMLERPMVNPRRFFSSVSAIRCLESTLCVIDRLKLRYENVNLSIIDSKEWQKKMLPYGASGSDLKFLSQQMGFKNHPQHSILLTKHRDGDGLHIMDYCRKVNDGTLSKQKWEAVSL